MIWDIDDSLIDTIMFHKEQLFVPKNQTQESYSFRISVRASPLLGQHHMRNQIK